MTTKAAGKAMTYEEMKHFKPSRTLIKKELRARSKFSAGSVSLAQASKWQLTKELWARVDVFAYYLVAGMVVGLSL